MNLHNENVVEKEVSSPFNDVHDDDVVNDANEVPKDPKQSYPRCFTLSLLFP